MPGKKDDLLSLKNIGKAALADLHLLGIETASDLAGHEADALFLRLTALTGKRHDPCVWDVFAAAIHQARTGEALPWWHWTADRKARQSAGTFV